MQKRAWLAMALAVWMAPAQALTFFDQAFVCPIGGEKFKQQQVASSFEAGRYLDLKSYGATLSPWPLPVCPGNGFVIYKKDYTGDEKAALATYIASDEYKALAGETPHYRAAMLMRKSGTDRTQIAWMLLKASWEVDADARYARYAEAALQQYQQDLADNVLSASDTVTQRLLVGELLRRLSRFDEARTHFSALQNDAKDQPAMLQRIIAYQLELIGKSDAARHEIPKEPEAPKAP